MSERNGHGCHENNADIVQFRHHMDKHIGNRHAGTEGCKLALVENHSIPGTPVAAPQECGSPQQCGRTGFSDLDRIRHDVKAP